MPLPPQGDTITAIATAAGSAAVGIVRLSGPQSYPIAAQIFKPARAAKLSTLAAGRVVYGRLIDADELIDEALLLTFRAPHSYTGEDVLEIQSHGGPAVLRRVLELCLRHGARLAEPGEFTLRAYLAGRLDLVQAEAVLQLVNAQSEQARRNAAHGLGRALSEELEAMQQEITRVYGDIQAMFDYPDEGVPEADFIPPLARALQRIDKLLATARAGEISQRGARLALIGKPNAGKSSLLNALLGYQRSLVSDIPGTTRDYLEAHLHIGGIPITAVDTAGIRETDDQIEASGVELAKSIAQHADLTLLLLDSSAALDAKELEVVETLEPERLILVASKKDLPAAWTRKDLADAVPSVPIIAVTATITVTDNGLAALSQAITEKLLGDAAGSELWLGSERQREALLSVKSSVLRALDAPHDLAALDLEDALKTLGELTGQGDIAEEALTHIFANFCVGK